ncbi:MULTISPECIES: magnesium chelatase domain-containing protein [unclassified Rathayibacter]|uniref:magnesium chelatase domain-containing protein n=1 Tax=unclassified Rathayibacter TaxID=2609250 RepID=UPI0006F4AD30|nr:MULTISPECIES: magnesium chelatase domain-containing protein [unclassified Rathayibacter]KQQ00686.1 hypothetical protein ASF42_15250 [Rathayibacter sp. Leaf294]KQS10885.1 hypothetical protein ASG06_15250 [Rathayibacter sp. Leaf185]
MGLVGFTGAVVGVEAHSADGTPGVMIIGLPDAALSQAKERVRSAAINSGSVISEYKITVNLSPAAMPKHGSAFDLTIGLAALAALGEVNAESVASVVHVGELGLDGRLRSVAGVLPAVLAAAREGRRRVMVPSADRLEAELVDGVEVIAVSSLAAAAVWHGTKWELPVLPKETTAPAAPIDPEARLDFADVIGSEEVAEAMIVAAAGGRHVFLLPSCVRTYVRLQWDVMGTNRRYADSIDRQMAQRVAEAAVRPAPVSLTPEELDIARSPVCRGAAVKVEAWVRFHEQRVVVEAYAVEWNDRGVHVEWSTSDGTKLDAWVWANAVRRI